MPKLLVKQTCEEMLAEQEVSIEKLAMQWWRHNRNVPFDDVHQAARLGFVIAWDKFDPNRRARNGKKVKFITYAAHHGKNQIRLVIQAHIGNGFRGLGHAGGLRKGPLVLSGDSHAVRKIQSSYDTQAVPMAEMVIAKEPKRPRRENFWQVVTANLTKTQTRMLMYRYAHGFRNFEIARIENKSTATVSICIRTAIRKLREIDEVRELWEEKT